jgi:HipA-like C-terminal domain
MSQHNDDKRIYISVFLQGKGFVPAGVVLFNDVMNYGGFVYFQTYIDKKYPPLNPGTLNYQTQHTLHFPVDARTNPDLLDKTFLELLPSQGDFGTNVLVSKHPEYFSMKAAQKLHFLGSRVVGGLSCYVETPESEQNIVGLDWLDDIRRESVEFYTKQIASIKHVHALDALTSYGGVRPKAMYKDDDGQYWIAKFNVPSDPYNMARVEHLAMVVARDCGLNVPDTQVITLPSGEDVFLTKRFDRHNQSRHHGLSFFAMAPAVDFERTRPTPGTGHSAEVMGKIIARFSQNKTIDQELLAKKLLVDVGFNNTDNHLRNIRFILNDKNQWALSPSFDILFDPRDKPHTYSPAGLPRADTHLNNTDVIKKIAAITDLTYDQVAGYAAQTRDVLSRISEYASALNINMQDLARIETAVSLGTLGPEATFRIEQAKRLKNQQNIQRPKMRPSF